MTTLPIHILEAIQSGKVASPPEVLLRLLETLDDERATLGDLATLIRRDPGLTSRILAVANSPALQRGTRLLDIEACLNALGTRLVRSLATCLAVQRLFDQGSQLPAAQLGAFWSHALLVAELSRALASATAYPRPEEAYLAGLLHDVGQLLLLPALGEPYRRLLAEATDESTLTQAEQAQFGTTHAAIATWLAEQWQFDSAFADGILFQHAEAGQIGTATPLAQIVWLAETLAMAEEIVPATLAIYRQRQPAADENNLSDLRQQAERQTRQIGQALGVGVPERIVAQPVWPGLPASEARPSKAAAEDELSARVAARAALQPLQEELFTLENPGEILLALKQSARILFDLDRVAILLATPDGAQLSGADIGDQPALFSQISLPLDNTQSLLANATRCREVLFSFDSTEQTASSLLDRQCARALGGDGLLALPLATPGRTSGVLLAAVSRASHARLARRRPWLLHFGRIAAHTLSSLQQASDFRQQSEQAAQDRFTRQARRIVHEAGNPLGIIKSYLKILDRKLPDETTARQELGILREEIDRVAAIVGRMSELPPPASAAGGVDLGSLLGEMLQLYRAPLFDSRGIDCEFLLPTGPLTVKCDTDSLKQILLNLWKNAAEALQAGQRIAITTTGQVRHNGRQHVQLTIADNGPGLSDAALQSLTRPAEATGQGPRGMGLSIVGSLARAQGILLTCHSSPNTGTTTTLLLPTPEATAGHPEPPI